MNKRGGSSIAVETILLISFFIILTVTGYFWAKSRAEKGVQGTAEKMEAELQCSDMKILLICGDDDVLIKNNGFHSIKKLLVREQNTEDKRDFLLDVSELAPFAETSLGDLFAEYDEDISYEVMPVVEINKKNYNCKEKSIDVFCG